MKVAIKAVDDWNKKMAIPLSNALAASAALTGRSGRQACEHAMVLMAKSARARTRESQKMRKIVKNPDKGYKKDKRKAPFGVFVYRKGEKRFRPIFRTGEFGKNRFTDLKTMSVYDRSGGSGRWRKIASGADEANPEIIVPGIKTDKRRVIGRRGLAKRSWFWGLHGLRKAPAPKGKVIPGVSTLSEIRSRSTNGLILTNRLRYIKEQRPRRVTPPGLERIAAQKATSQIMRTAALAMERRFSIEIPRLAAQRKAKAAQKAERAMNKAWKATAR